MLASGRTAIRRLSTGCCDPSVVIFLLDPVFVKAGCCNAEIKVGNSFYRSLFLSTTEGLNKNRSATLLMKQLGKSPIINPDLESEHHQIFVRKPFGNREIVPANNDLNQAQTML